MIPTAIRLHYRPRLDGFTLIELVIALAMVALISVLLFSGLRLGSRAWNGVDAVAERTGAIRQAEVFLRRTLAQARASSAVYDGQLVQVFAGDDSRLEFAAPLSDHVGVPGIYILRLTLEGGGRRRNLVLTRWLMHPEILEGKADNPEWKPLKDDSFHSLESLPLDGDAVAGAFGRTLLLEGVEGLEISYYGISNGETDGAWKDRWIDEPQPPSLVRIRLTAPDRTWPDLVVAIDGSRA